MKERVRLIKKGGNMFCGVIIGFLLVVIALLLWHRHRYFKNLSGETEEARIATMAKSEALKALFKFFRSDPNLEEQIKDMLENKGGKELLLELIVKTRVWVKTHGYDREVEEEIISYLEGWYLEVSYKS